MGAASQISWTDATFNHVIGCQKVSPACANCYAEVSTPVRVAAKIGLKLWGGESTGAVRRVASESMWKEPIKWNKKAAKEGQRKRVFCASLADVFEEFNGKIVDGHGEEMFSTGDNPHWQPAGTVNKRAFPGFDPKNDTFRTTLNDIRSRLFDLINETPWLDWLLLTKRPENIMRMVPGWWKAGVDGCFPSNVWMGTTVESQEYADQRIPELLKVPARIRFVSCEPMVGPIEFSDVTHRSDAVSVLGKSALSGIHWVIAGGESQTGARPHDIEWFRSLRDQCQAAGVPYHFKQWGEWCPFSQIPDGVFEKLGTDVDFEALPVQVIGEHSYHRIGKKLAGRQLDGREWNEVPQ